ncbi:MAG TPA: serine/threonine-protein kinase [Kofleriaceae bacterium]
MARQGFDDDDRPTVDIGSGVLDKQGEGALDDLGPEPNTEANADVGATRTLMTPTPPPGPAQPGTIERPVTGVHAMQTAQLQTRRTRGGTNSIDMNSRTAAPAEAMRQQEIERSRVFLKVAFFLSIAGAIIASITSGDPIAQRVVGIGSVFGTIGAAWMYFRLREDNAYSGDLWVLPGLCLLLGAMSGLYYWGVASPVAAMLVYGIYFFAMGSSKKFIFVMYLLCAIGHGLLFLSIMFGFVTDRGLVNIGGLRPLEQVAITGIVEALYFLAFLTARLSQRSAIESMLRLEVAARGMAQREAMLAEARADLDRALKIGGPGRFTEQIIGSFKLGVLIGRGGMGEVYEAQPVTAAMQADGAAAVKLLHPGTLADPTSVARFIREAQTAARLDTPYVVRVREVGTTAGEIPFLAMEHLRGNDLAQHLRKVRRIPLAEAAVVASHVARGLEAARVAGIVHRDLKPHNVFSAEVGKGHIWKILDFGVSKAGGSGTLTKGHVVGTPAYMAPEQARGEDVDHRADVYSLAAILYRSITGHPAFTGKDVPTTLYDVVYRVPTQPSLLLQLPNDVDRVLAIGLAKSADDRFATSLELAQWFAAAIEDKLTPEQRERADQLIVKQPWGTRTFAGK